jgi:Cdc6-like AAA superfamily ATPase
LQSLLVLDEADHLKDDSVLPFFYALSAKPNSKLSMIGIANSLDLASRLSFSKHNVGAIEFTPYTAADMSLIAKQRLLPLSADATLPCIAAPALELASKRVAGVSGDLRTFLSIVRKAIELVEPLSPDSPSSSTPPKATPSHVLKALKACSLSAVHNPSATLETALESAPFHARIVLAGLCISFARLASSAPSPKGKASTESLTYDSAWSTYSEVLKQAEKEMMAQSRGDYENLLDTLAVIGLATLQTVSMPSPKSKAKNSPRASSSQRQRTISLVHPLTLNEAAVKHGEGEAAAVVSALFNAETRKQKKKLRLKEWDEAAPMSGFHGDGLDGKEDRMMGKAARGRNEDSLEEEDDL